jgi:hypothetical protein
MMPPRRPAGCRDLTDEPFVRNSNTPEAWLSEIPSAATPGLANPRSSAATKGRRERAGDRGVLEPAGGKLRATRARADETSQPSRRRREPPARALRRRRRARRPRRPRCRGRSTRRGHLFDRGQTSPPLMSAASAGAPLLWPSTVAVLPSPAPRQDRGRRRRPAIRRRRSTPQASQMQPRGERDLFGQRVCDPARSVRRAPSEGHDLTMSASVAPWPGEQRGIAANDAGERVRHWGTRRPRSRRASWGASARRG